MILKLLLVAAVIFVVYMMFFKPKGTTTLKKQKKQTKKDDPINELIQCPTCDVYVEVEEAILSASTYYCSSECINKVS